MKVLILSASTGGGHMRASAALKSYILEHEADAQVEIVDTLAYISPLLNKTITEGYVTLATKTPKMYGSFYKSSNKEKGLGAFVVAFNKMFSKKLLPLLDEFQPDVIVSTHAFVTEMVSDLKGQGLVSIPLICLLTDYAPHQTWIAENVDHYIVSNEGMIDVMVQMGAPRERIHPYGIPIDHAFYTKKDRDAILDEMNLKPNIPTILIMAGSFGVTNILRIYNNIVKIPEEFQIIVITGRNQRLYDAFERVIQKSIREKPQRLIVTAASTQKTTRAKPVKKPKPQKERPHKTTRLLYFTTEVDKYMQVADLIITKPGGLTVSEALACNLPMAIFDAIPGQEEENADFLIDNNMAVKIEKGATCAQTIQELLQNHDKLEAMKQSCQTFDKSRSGENIVNLIAQLIGEKNAAQNE